jgi:hypothetical protein
MKKSEKSRKTGATKESGDGSAPAQNVFHFVSLHPVLSVSPWGWGGK